MAEILIVEDELSINELIRRNLSPTGHHCTQAFDGLSAVTLLEKKKIEECKLIDSSVSSVEYNCQGYSGNDPTITVDVIGKNGEIVNMSFSRYDQTFLGLITDTSRKVIESALDRLEKLVDVENENIAESTVTWTTSVIR